MEDKYDDTLFSVLKEAKTLPNFFDILFGFLYRRTDFYHVSSDPNLGVGLSKGVAESILMHMYNKYAQNEVVIEHPIEEVVITEEIAEATVISSDKTDVPVTKPSSSLDCYNGAAYENYSWSQTITEIDIQVKIPEKQTSRQLCVEITSTKICVKSKNSNTVFLEGELCRKCKTQETIWSLDGCILQIHLEKVAESWWECLLQSEPKLDFTKMDCSRPFHELSDEAQAKLEELSWNQERKRQGLPTSDQLELEKTLKKAWNAEGSPFNGEYDPSNIALN